MQSIFISHALADKSLAGSLYDLLQTGCNLGNEDIVCTSVDGVGIPGGEDFVEWIKKNLETASLIILLVTPNYFASKFCMAEVGAAWALNKKVFPLMKPKLHPEMGFVMLGKQTYEMSGVGLDQLRDEIAKFFPKAGNNTGRWNIKKEVFLNTAPTILENLPEPNLVERSTFQGEQEKVAASLEVIQELNVQNANLQKQIADLETLKDKDAVQEIKFKSLPSTEQYNLLTQSVKKELSKHSAPEVMCLYALFSENCWYINDNTWREIGKEIDNAIKSSWIVQVNNRGGYAADETHPRNKLAIIAIEKLSEYIKGMDIDLQEMIKEKEEYKVDIKNLEYWSKAFDKPYLLTMDLS